MSQRLLKRMDPWLRLVRVGNLFTVPGDPLAGALAASVLLGVAVSVWRLLGVALSTMLIYAGGLILNDVCDMGNDRRSGRDRPLVNGDISVQAAWCVAFFCLVAGGVVALLCGVRSFVVAALLIGMVVLYDTLAKQVALHGAVAMGVCRGLAVLLGASLVGWPAFIVYLVIGWAVYIGGVTWLARNETRTMRRRGCDVMLVPVAAGFVLLGAVVRLGGTGGWLSLTTGLVLSVLVVGALAEGGRRVTGDWVSSAMVQQQVGRMIRMLVWVQAGVVVLTGHPWSWSIFFLLAVCWGLAWVLGRRYAAS